MKKIISMISMAFVVIFLASCSEDSTSVPADTSIKTNLFEFGQMNRITFRQYRMNLDSSEIAETVQEGVMEYLADTVIENYTAKMFEKVIQNSDPKIHSKEIYQVSADSNEFRINSKSINDVVNLMSPNPSIVLPLVLPEMMVKIGDRKNTSWGVYTQDVVDFKVLTGIVANGKFAVSAKRGAEGTTYLGTNKVNTREFILTFDFTGTISSTGDAQQKISVEIYYLFAEGKGLVGYMVPNFSTMGFPIAGFQNKVISIN